MDKTIQQLLAEVKEDKKDNLATTSFRFKEDLWDFFQGSGDKVAVEFGTHKGQTTRILSHLCRKVYTVNMNGNEEAKRLNADRDNIVYIDYFDLYSTKMLPITEKVDIVLIDAGHSYGQVIDDINRAITLPLSSEVFIVFDDYGLEKFEREVKKAVDQAVDAGLLQIVKFIGHEPGHSFGGTPPRILKYPEGVITKVVFPSE